MIIVLCGLPGSGKTTLSHKLSKKYNAKAYSFDDFLQGNKGKTLKDFYQYLYQQSLTENIIIDTINLGIKVRLSLLKYFKDIEKSKILIVMTTPVEECIRRNNKRQRKEYVTDSMIYFLSSKYEPPTLDEGWDEILYY